MHYNILQVVRDSVLDETVLYAEVLTQNLPTPVSVLANASVSGDAISLNEAMRIVNTIFYFNFSSVRGIEFN